MPTTFNVLFLGNAADIDPTEGNNDAEDALNLVGQSFGGPGDGLLNNILEFAPGTIGFDAGGVVLDYDQDQLFSAEFFTLDGGPDVGFDSVALFDATLTFIDGSTGAITAIVVQDVNGDLYLFPEISANADQALLESQAIQSITLNTLLGNNFSGIFNDRQGFEVVLCLVQGALIETLEGETSTECLSQGDMVLTLDNGYQPIRWISSFNVSPTELESNPKLRPIRIRSGALGPNMPSSDLLVSQQHRILIRSKVARKMFQQDEVLIAAKHLVTLDGIDVAHDIEDVVYCHFLFDQHEIIFSNGAKTESLYTGPEALKSISQEARDEILSIFPELNELDYKPLPCRQLVKGRMSRRLAVRHSKNMKPLVQESLQ